MAISFTSDGWYICRVDTGIGEQYAAVQFTKPPVTMGPLGAAASQYDPLSNASSHFKELASGPAPSAEQAWANWRASLPLGHAFA